MSCYDRLGRLIGSDDLEHEIDQEKVAQCAPDKFVVCYDSDDYSPKLCVYNSSLQRVRNVPCTNYLTICCNSKFVFGLWNTRDSYDADTDDEDYNPDTDNGNYEDDDDDDEYDDDGDIDGDNDSDDEDNDEQEEEAAEEEEVYSTHRIQARRLDTLNKAFVLCVPEQYTMRRIMADEHHLVAMSRVASVPGSCHWFMSVFNLQAIYAETGFRDKAGKKTRKIFQAERHVRLDIEPIWLPSAFLFHGWLVVVLTNELAWFDKEGARSATSTEWDSNNWKGICASGSSLQLIRHDGKHLLKR